MNQVDSPRAQPYIAIEGLSVVRKVKGDAGAAAWGTPKMNVGAPVMDGRAERGAARGRRRCGSLRPAARRTRDNPSGLACRRSAVGAPTRRTSASAKHFEQKGTERGYLYGRAVMGMEDESAITPSERRRRRV